jgi:hypothetical protein
MIYPLQEKPEWRNWVVPKALHVQPIHRWYVFPHSFTAELVHALIDEWGLSIDDHVLDPFVGAGTTLLSTKEKGIPASGYDLSPLAVLAARVKIADHHEARLRHLWSHLDHGINRTGWDSAQKEYSNLVSRALPGKLLGAFDAINRAITDLNATSIEQDFFRLALLSVIPKCSRAVAEGGWLKWIERRSSPSTLATSFRQQVAIMLGDLPAVQLSGSRGWRVQQADARSLPDAGATYNAVITSPPYPNRHDYTRVFGVELMFGFLDWNQTRQLRYQSFHSHPEARPLRPEAGGYVQPNRLTRALVKIQKRREDPRIIKS